MDHKDYSKISYLHNLLWRGIRAENGTIRVNFRHPSYHLIMKLREMYEEGPPSYDEPTFTYVELSEEELMWMTEVMEQLVFDIS